MPPFLTFSLSHFLPIPPSPFLPPPRSLRLCGSLVGGGVHPPIADDGNRCLLLDD